MTANTLSFGETFLKAVKLVCQSMLLSATVFSCAAHAFESRLEEEIQIHKHTHSMQIEYCSEKAKKIGPITLDLSRLNGPDFNKAMLQTALARISQGSVATCERETLLPLVNALTTFRQRVVAQHPFMPEVEELLNLLVPSRDDLDLRERYDALPRAYKDELETQLVGKLYSIRQIQNFAEIRATLK